MAGQTLGTLWLHFYDCSLSHELSSFTLLRSQPSGRYVMP